MTSTVKITAHCASTKEVIISLDNGNNTGELHRLQDGETKELHVYDDRRVTVQERLKDAQEV